jgi:HK97 family phage major capsid protein
MNKCPFCGKDITADVGECPHCKKSLETVKSVATVVKDNLKPFADDLKTVKEKVEKLEKLPIMTANFNINKIANVYRGRKLSLQGAKIRSLAGDHPGMFDAFRHEEALDEYVKGIIDLVLGLPRVRAKMSEKALAEIKSPTGLNEGTTTAGGYLVPPEYQWDIVQLARNKSYALQFCDVIPMASDILYLPKETTLPSVSWTLEGGTMSDSDPVFDQVKLTANKLTAFSTVTNELLADSALDVVSIITEQFIYGMAQELDNQMFNGTGTPVSGILTADCGYSVVLGTGSASFSMVTATDISNMIAQLQQGYLEGARFFVNRKGLHYLRALKSTINTLIFAQMGGTVPNTLWEYPILMSEKITNTDGASTAFVIFGQFNRFKIGRRQGAMAIEADPYTKFTTDETQFRMITRWGMANAMKTAFVRLLTSA